MKSLLTLLSNYIYLIQKLNKTDQKLFWICCTMITIGFGIPLSNVFFPKMVVWCVTQNPSSLGFLMGVIACFFIITGLCNGIHNYFIRRNNFYLSNFGYKLREDIQEISMTMPFPMTENSKTRNEIKLAENCISQTKPIIETFCSCVSAMILLVGYAVFIMKLSPWILLIFIAVVLLNALMMSRLKTAEAEQRTNLANAVRQKEYLFQTMFDYRFGKELRLFHLTDTLNQKFKAVQGKKYALYCAIERKKIIAEGAEGILHFICEVTIYGFLFLAYLNRGLTVDDFVFYIGLAASFTVISKGFIGDLSNLFLLNAAISDYRNFVETKQEASEQISATECEKTGNCEIIFSNVSFRYPGTKRDVLHNISFVIEPGSHLSIVGRNGAGKSTIVKLICRLYRPDSGKITMDGRDIWDYNLGEYMEKISAVFQESRLFACTLEENICLQEPPDLPRMWDALHAVGMEDKIRALPNREKSNILKYLFDDGLEFSGGETQRLCIARAVYKQCPILLLDEPTAALDALAEKSIYESFSQVSRGKTTIFISHRLNSNRFSDKVIFLEEGQITAQGTHDELMDYAPYRELYMMQAQYYLPKEVQVK